MYYQGMGRYKGDTPRKKVARLFFWSQAINDLSDERVLKAKIMVVSGPTAGDVATLLGIGIPPENILAVDKDPEAIAYVRTAWPEVRTFQGDYLDAAMKHRREFDAIHIDLCRAMDPAEVAKIGKAAQWGLKSRGKLGLALSYGREGEAGKKVVDKARERVEEDALMIHYGEAGAVNTLVAMGMSREEAERHQIEVVERADERGPKLARVRALDHALLSASYNYRFHALITHAWFYRSNDMRGVGTPMMYALASFERHTGTPSANAFDRWLSKQRATLPFINHKDVSDGHFNSTYEEAVDEFGSERADLLLNTVEDDMEPAKKLDSRTLSKGDKVMVKVGVREGDGSRLVMRPAKVTDITRRGAFVQFQDDVHAGQRVKCHIMFSKMCRPEEAEAELESHRAKFLVESTPGPATEVPVKKKTKPRKKSARRPTAPPAPAQSPKMDYTPPGQENPMLPGVGERLSDWIARCRKGAAFKQTDLAKALNWKPHRVSQLEQARYLAEDDEVLALAELFETDLGDVMKMRGLDEKAGVKKRQRTFEVTNPGERSVTRSKPASTPRIAVKHGDRGVILEIGPLPADVELALHRRAMAQGKTFDQLVREALAGFMEAQ